MSLRFSIKKGDKWATIANYGHNKFGNMELSINKEVLLELLKDKEKKYINLAVFENKPKDEATTKQNDSNEAPF